jgi:peptidoglycan/LPS O-acetylase OafA/YrhL
MEIWELDFFVISGFLITYLLLREVEKYGRIDIKAFYERRALRILPVYSAYLIVVAVLQCLTIVQQPLVTWVGDLTFTVNFLPRGHISGHLWSLAVEEQFYFMWPLILTWLCSRKKIKPIVVVLPVPIFTAFLFHIIAREKAYPWILHSLFYLHSSFLNFDSLDMGCIAAFLLVKHEDRLINALKSKKHWAITILGAGMVLVTPVWHICVSLISWLMWRASPVRQPVLPFSWYRASFIRFAFLS